MYVCRLRKNYRTYPRQFEGFTDIVMRERRCCLACGETEFEASKNEASAAGLCGRSNYQYKRLNYKLGQEIRLCVIRPGEHEDGIHYDIIHVNLEDGPEYEAVSYTRASPSGRSNPSRSVHCGSCRYIPVAFSCEAALRQLRKRWTKRVLWIDAIYIDQSNVIERGHQVGFMDQIYDRASSVRICLQDHMSWTYRGHRDFASMFKWLQESPGAEEREKESHNFPLLVNLLENQYFKRSWVSSPTSHFG